MQLVLRGSIYARYPFNMHIHIILFLLLDCGINLPNDELTEIVDETIEALSAQILERTEAERLELEVQTALKAKDLDAVSCFVR